MNSSKSRWSAVVLAAGASTRMGTPKPLLDFFGESFLDVVTGMFAEVCDAVIVVTGYQAEQVRAGTRRANQIHWAANPHPELGQLSSLQYGLYHVPEGCEAVFFQSVDSPGVQVETLRELQDRWAAANPKPAFVIPVQGDRRGHPVGVSRHILPEFLSLDPATQTAREVVHRHRSDTLYVGVNDPAIHWDIDNPEEYQRLCGKAQP